MADPSNADARRQDGVLLADAIVQAWEQTSIPFDRAHQLQMALVAARFIVAIADEREGEGAALEEGRGS